MLQFLARSLSLSLGLSGALSLALCLAASASAPELKTQAPGFYRLMVGTVEITVLFDGFYMMKPKDVLKAPEGPKVQGLLAGAFRGDVIPTSVNAFLVNTGSRLILIDTGCGAFFGPSFGHIIENLKASGYTPEQVDEVEITHMHTDHLGGVVLNGKAVFPNATLRMDQRDSDFWLNPPSAEGQPDQLKGMVVNAIASVAPYKANGHFKPFQGKTELAPGVTAIPAYGHTPGHTAYQVESQGQKLLLVGDILHMGEVQFADPSAAVTFDSNSKEAVAKRKEIFKEAAKDGFLIGAAHLPFPGIGHVGVDKCGGGYRYLPIPYSPLTSSPQSEQSH